MRPRSLTSVKCGTLELRSLLMRIQRGTRSLWAAKHVGTVPVRKTAFSQCQDLDAGPAIHGNLMQGLVSVKMPFALRHLQA